ncbi:unnamed protein product [Pedinophyceae sp. YPF-701]|nr:unnamed protein product [Pedinophyceae sp. YPF-701]
MRLASGGSAYRITIPGMRARSSTGMRLYTYLDIHTLVGQFTHADTYVLDANPGNGVPSAPEAPRSYERSPYPLSAIIGNQAAKLALILTAVEPALGGVVLAGPRGSGKTLMARALSSLLPPLDVVKGSIANADPDDPSTWEDGLGAEGMERDVRRAPFVTVPLGVTDDRVIGTVDVERSIAAGRPVIMPGLLAESSRGILYLDELNLMDEATANQILATVAAGRNDVEREGLSFSHPCLPSVLATFNPAEGPVRPHLIDRFAVVLPTERLATPQRAAAAHVADAFAAARSDADTEEYAQLRAFFEQQEALTRTRIAAGRLLLREGTVQILPRHISSICAACSQYGVEGNRVEVQATRAALASAAYAGRQRVGPTDVRLAVDLVIKPRGVAPPQLAPAPPPPPPAAGAADDDDAADEEGEEDDAGEGPPSDEEDVVLPEEFMIEAEDISLDPAVLASGVFARQRQGGGGREKKHVIFSETRGRYVKPMFPKGRPKRLAIDATLRAAAPHQRARRARRDAAPQEAQRARRPRVIVERDDLRVKRMARKAGALVVLVVDASGSMALNRMASAKGAALQLLSESYIRRDQVALIEFHGMTADVLLPPTRALAMAQRRLEVLPCGGGSPMAHALMLALDVAETARKRGSVGRAVAVLITDGRANVPLSVSRGGSAAQPREPSARGAPQEPPAPSALHIRSGVTEQIVVDVPKADVHAEVVETARRLQAAKIDLVVVDTELPQLRRGKGLGQEVADAAGGMYVSLPGHDAGVRATASAAAAAVAK